MNIGNNTASNSTSSGALQVLGGIGVSGNVYTGGIVNIGNNTASNSTSSGALIVSGGVGIQNDLYVGGNIYMNGVVVGTGTGTGPTLTSTNTLSVSKLYINTNINTGLIQYYPFDTSLSNLASGYEIYDVSNGLGDSFPVLIPGKPFTNVSLIPSSTGYVDIIDTNSIGLYYTFEYSNLLIQKPNFGATNNALFSTNTSYICNNFPVVIPNSFSISFWICLCGYYPGYGPASIVNISFNSTQITLDITANGNVRNNLGQVTNYQLLSNAWTNIAWVYDGSNNISSMYINSVLTNTGSAQISSIFGSNTSVTCNPSKICIGYNYNFGYVSQYGYELQQYRLYGRVLGTDEISNIFNNTGIYYNQIIIPPNSVEIITGDLGVAGNTIITQNLGVGTNNPQYTVDICGNLNVRGTLNTSNSTQLTYSTLPTLNSYQVGYTAYGTLYNTGVLPNTVNNISQITVPMGVWMFNAQGVFQTTTATAVNITTAILSLYNSATSIQSSSLASLTNTPPYAFSQLYLTNNTLGVGMNVQNNYYSTNITQILTLNASSQTIYLNSLFVGGNIACDISSSYFSATRLA